MASINGIILKNLHPFRGHEGEPLVQADVWDGKTKLGYWSQDAHGGSDNYDRGVYEAVKPKAEEYQRGFDKSRYIIPSLHDSHGDPGILLEDLAMLTLLEKDFKRNAKLVPPGEKFTVLFFESKMTGDFNVRVVGGVIRTMEEALKYCPTVVKKAKRVFGGDEIVLWPARTLADFNITVDENHPAPDILYNPTYCTFGGATA